MKKLYLIKSAITSALILGASTASATIDPAAAIVELRQNCTENNVTLDNCFTGFQNLRNWMRDTRRPNAQFPLHVNIGPGTFNPRLNTPDGFVIHPDIKITCDSSNSYTGYTSFQGSGNTQTILNGTGSGSTSAINITNCTDLSFSDLKITTTAYGGIYWNGGGDSRWTNVEVETKGRAWAEPVCGAERGKHYWYSSKLNTNAAFGIADTYRASCDETWFFGSEIKGTVPEGGSAVSSSGVISTLGRGIIHLYGSNLRSLNHGSRRLIAANSVSGEIHIHGTGIDVISTTGGDIIALSAGTNGFIHADSSAFVLQTTGTKNRILNNGGKINAHYQWSQDNQPPQIFSENGADMAIETHCDSITCHDEDTGTETHLLIYNDNCNVAGHGPWFDVVTGKCRGDMTVN